MECLPGTSSTRLMQKIHNAVMGFTLLLERNNWRRAESSLRASTYSSDSWISCIPPKSTPVAEVD
jgi:hypothetical protein